MDSNDILPQDTDKPLRNIKIEITKRTVRFGSEIYQFRNVTGFGISSVTTDVNTKNIFAMQFILGLFVIGIFLANFPDWRRWGVTLISISIGGLYANTSQPKEYGLKLYLNSGYPSPVFITRDIRGLKEVVSTLYNFMENNEEATYIIYAEDRSMRIENRYIQIEGSVGGSVIAGNIGGSLSSNVGGNVSRKN